MKFKMNDNEWEIKEISNAEMNDMFGEDGYTDGVTCYGQHIIYINNDIIDKKRTLYHELMHCFLYEYGHNQNADKSFSYDDVCEVSACSHDMIHSIVEEYFKEVEIENVESKYSCKSNTQIIKEMADAIKMQQEWDKINPAGKAVGA